MLRRFARKVTAGRRFYRRSFIWFLFATSFPGLIIGASTYWFAVRTIKADISELHQKQITARVQNIDDQFMTLELDLSHWAFNPRFGFDLKELNFIYEFKESWDLSKTLYMMQGSHPLIEKIQLFIAGDKPVLFQPEYYELTDETQIAGFERLLAENKYIFWTDWVPKPASDESETDREPADPPLVLIHKVPGDSTTPFGVIVAQLNRDKVINLLRTLTPYNEGANLLLNSKGNLILSDDQSSDSLVQALIGEILNREEETGTFAYVMDGIMYSVSYGKMMRVNTEWTYISAAPMNAIISPVVRVSNTIILVSASGLFLALLLSWLATSRIYSPINRLVSRLAASKAADIQSLDEFQYLESQWNQLANESLNLRQRLEDQRTLMRSGFLLQLLQGHLKGYSEEDLRERFKLLGWDIVHHEFRVLYLHLLGFDMLQQRYNSGDESLVTFAAANIVEELAGGKFEQFCVVNFHNLTIGLLVMSPKGQAMADDLQELGEAITKSINQILKMQVTIIISEPVTQIKEVPDLFMEVERASGYREFVNQNQLIHMEKWCNPAGVDEVRYPFALERDIVQALRIGDKEEAERLVTLFLKVVRSHHGTELHVQQCMLQLFGTIQHSILQSGINTYQLFNGTNMFSQLSKIRDPDKMLHWMKDKVISPFIEERQARANTELKRLVEQTIEYIHANYTKDISLDIIADKLGTSPYTLSKLFKQMTGINYIDYVTELRIEKAKKLLMETDLKINDIALEVGYQQRYFNRIFKKQVGLTPGQFREQLEQ